MSASDHAQRCAVAGMTRGRGVAVGETPTPVPSRPAQCSPMAVAAVDLLRLQSRAPLEAGPAPARHTASATAQRRLTAHGRAAASPSQARSNSTAGRTHSRPRPHRSPAPAHKADRLDDLRCSVAARHSTRQPRCCASSTSRSPRPGRSSPSTSRPHVEGPARSVRCRRPPNKESISAARRSGCQTFWPALRRQPRHPTLARTPCAPGRTVRFLSRELGRQGLVGEAHVCGGGGVALGRCKVDQPALGQQEDPASVRHVELLHHRPREWPCACSAGISTGT